MNLAVRIIESEQSHAQELRTLRSPDPRTITRLREIAAIYSRGVSPAKYDAFVMGELMFELKSARERFGLWDDLVIARAIDELKDPLGW